MEAFLNTSTAVGIFAVFTLMLFKEIRLLIRERKFEREPDRYCRNHETIVEMRRMIEDLHAWHDVKDEDGVHRWIVRGSLEQAIIKMTEAVQQMAKLTERLTDKVELLDANVKQKG
jgi:hypothetical protein